MMGWCNLPAFQLSMHEPSSLLLVVESLRADGYSRLDDVLECLVAVSFSEPLARTWLGLLDEADRSGLATPHPAGGMFQVDLLDPGDTFERFPHLFDLDVVSDKVVYDGEAGSGIALVRRSDLEGIGSIPHEDARFEAGGGVLHVRGEGVGASGVHWNSIALYGSEIYEALLANAEPARRGVLAAELAQREGELVGRLLRGELQRHTRQGPEPVATPDLTSGERAFLLTAASREVREAVFVQIGQDGRGGMRRAR